MKFVILIICFNLIGIYSKENLKPVPVHRPEKVIKVYRIIRPVRVVPAAIYRHGIEIQFVKDPITAPRELFTSATTPIAKSPASFESFHTLAHVQRSDPIIVLPTVSKTTTESSIVPIAKTSASSDLIEALKLHLKTGLLTRTILHPVTKHLKGERRAATRSNLDQAFESTTKRLAYKEDLDKLLEEVAAKHICTENHDEVTPPQYVMMAASVTPVQPPLQLNNIHDVLDLLKAGIKVSSKSPQEKGKYEWMKIKVPKN